MHVPTRTHKVHEGNPRNSSCL